MQNMKIADIDLGEFPVLLAPMEDVTDPAFRLMCKEFGADMVYTEFVSADALIRSVARTEQKLAIADAERPVAIQISDATCPRWSRPPASWSRHAPMSSTSTSAAPSSAWRARGAGAGMLRNVPLMLEITSAVVRAVTFPSP